LTCHWKNLPQQAACGDDPEAEHRRDHGRFGCS
jgi:hypothetical protein